MRFYYARPRFARYWRNRKALKKGLWQRKKGIWKGGLKRGEK